MKDSNEKPDADQASQAPSKPRRDFSHVTPQAFVEALTSGFGPELGTPVLGQSRIRPSDGKGVFWAYRPGTVAWDQIHHLSLALQEPTSPHQTSRKRNFKAGIALVLDDIREKAPCPRLKPTWILGTKPGSQQWGYLFREPVTDAVLFDQMIRACCDAGISDPGMRNIVRWFRLPGSKPCGKKHAARLLFWEPQRRFPADRLLSALGVFHMPPRRRLWTSGGPVKPEDIRDPVWTWLRDQGHLGQACADGWYEVPCPCWEEHSDGEVRAYYLPTHVNNPLAGFNCFHSHPLTIADFDKWVLGSGGPSRTAPASTEFDMTEGLDQ